MSSNEVTKTDQPKDDMRFVYLYVPLATRPSKRNPKAYGRHRFGIIGFKTVDGKVRVSCSHIGLKDFNKGVKFDRELGLKKVRLRLDGADPESKAKRQYVEFPITIKGNEEAQTLRGVNVANVVRKMFGSNHLRGNFLPLLIGNAEIEDIEESVQLSQGALITSVVSSIAPSLVAPQTNGRSISN